MPGIDPEVIETALSNALAFQESRAKDGRMTRHHSLEDIYSLLSRCKNEDSANGGAGGPVLLGQRFLARNGSTRG